MRSASPLLIALFAVGPIACSKSPAPTPDAGPPDAGHHSDAGVDAGPVDAGPPTCVSDATCDGGVCDPYFSYCVAPCPYDSACGPGRICDATGHCAAAETCDPASGSDPCASSDSTDYCFNIGDKCVCQADVRTDAGGNPGYCQRVRPLCARCTTEADCSTCPGNDSACDTNNFVYPVACAPVGSMGSYCLRKTIIASNCPNGYVADPVSQTCQPMTGMCSSGPAGCTSDSDCLAQLGPGSLCDVSSGLCKQACSFEYDTGSSNNCPIGEVCDVLPAFVLPDSGFSNYGLGHCTAPCGTPDGEDCAAVGAADGLTFACVTEKSGEHRCRPIDPDAGVTCMNSLECPRTTDGGPYAGYCSIYAFECNYDCRDGVNPIDGTQYGDLDCAPPAGSSTSYKCVNNQCVEKTCIELGGAQYGSRDQLCCGEDRDHTGIGDAGFADLTHPANACPTGVDAGAYYIAPAPPWCLPTCSNAALNLPDGGMVNAFQESLDSCSVDAGLPSFDSSPNICIDYNQGVLACAIAAPFTSVCPQGWGFGPPFYAGCNTNADCDSQLADGGMTDGGYCLIKHYPDAGVESQYCACDDLQPERLDAGPGVLGPYLWGGEWDPLESTCRHASLSIL